MQQQADIKIIEENLIVKNEKRTIGELDLLLLKNEQPIHLEIIYKFYLYDSAKTYNNSLDYWVGPNRGDTLINKLNKLKNQQFPLLEKPETKTVLQHYNFSTIKQQVCFKAQLFMPYKHQNIAVMPLNSQCVTGWYISFKQLDELKDFQFYIPTKLEWLCLPKYTVNWIAFSEVKTVIESYITNKRSPLCWLKSKTNTLQKCFITWWN